MNIVDRLIESIKQQAELFILTGEGFYPFATLINSDNEIIPIGAYIEGEAPESSQFISMLEKRLMENVNYKMGAIIVDIVLSDKAGLQYDALQIRLFENGKYFKSEYLKYSIFDNEVNFYQS